jgi:PAS domain S-box-containing protein
VEIDVFAAAPDAIVVVDDAGVIIAANDQTSDMFGYDAGELVGRPLEVLIPQRFKHRHVGHRRAYAAAPTRRPMGLALELFGQRKTGEEFPVEISLNYERDGSGRLLTIAFVRDATAKRELEVELRASEERFRLLVEGVEDYAIFQLDPQGRVLTWNQGAQRIKGWAPDDIIGRHFSVFYTAEDVDAGMPARDLERATTDGRVQSEGWRVRAGGERFWAATTLSALRDGSGKLRGFAKITRDRTESRQARARLESIAVLNRAVLEDQPQDELLEIVTQRAEAMLGDRPVALWSPSGDGTLTVTHAAGADANTRVGTKAAADSAVVTAARTASTELAANGLFVALHATGETFGVLEVLANGAVPLQSHEIELVQAFGTQAALSLAFARARAEAEQLHLVSERERIARELHDTVIQRLFAVGLALEATSRRPPSEMHDRLQQAVGDIDETIRSIRSSIFTLETRVETAPALRSRVLDVVADCANALGFEPAVSFDGPVDTLATKTITDSLIAVLREALSNVARHARATTATVTVTAHDDLTLFVTDDGDGAASFSREGGHGVSNLHERARVLGGDASIGTIEPHGTRVQWRVPLDTAEN